MMPVGATLTFAALTALLGAESVGMYLPPSQTGGTEFQFNPASPELRQAIKQQREPRPDDLLDAGALAEDLVFLRRALRKLYVGYPELLQVPNFDVEALFDQHIARLRGGPAKVKFGDSALALFRTLKRHINDHHLAMVGADPDPHERYAEFQATLTGTAPALDNCTAPRASPTTLRIAPSLGGDGKHAQLLTVSAPRQAETLELSCGEKRFVLTARPRSTREDKFADKPAYEWRRAGQAAILRIRRFMGSPVDLEQLERLPADYTVHRRSPLIVVDLRGNIGGNDDYAYRWVAQGRRGVWEIGMWSVYPMGGFLPWVLWNDEVWNAIRFGHVDDPAAVARRDKIRAQWPRSPEQLSVEFKRELNKTNPKTPYHGRILVLVDSRCSSSGESAAMFFREGLGAKLVGERTAGNQEFVHVRPLVLPRTHLRVYFGTKRNYFLTPVESVGIPADAYLPPELMAKPVEELLPLLKTWPR